MRVGVLTSSRADYGIYLPLLKGLKQDPFFKLNIVAFGTHLSHFHGYTANQITGNGFEIKYKLETVPKEDTATAIADSIGETIRIFAQFWGQHKDEFDIVICLGDRYEMFAAVMAGVPLQVKFAHLHGGEKTLGAIDNVLRHAISHASFIHFTATQFYADRLKVMLDSPENIFYVGSLSLQNLVEIPFLSLQEFKDKWDIDLNLRTVLVTFHPETVNSAENTNHANELVALIKQNKALQFLITMPNADTSGNEIRAIFKDGLEHQPHVKMLENMGTQGYFTAMKYAIFLLGNTSSGIIEAASFKKYVINLGNRQEGRYSSKNIFHVPVKRERMQVAIDEIIHNPEFTGENVYFKEDPVKNVITVLKSININE